MASAARAAKPRQGREVLGIRMNDRSPATGGVTRFMVLRKPAVGSLFVTESDTTCSNFNPKLNHLV
jgi:hypothetical protein